MPILICLKVFSKKNTNVFVMGLYTKISIINFLKYFIIYTLLVKACVSYILFLGKGEYQKAKYFINLIRNLSIFHFVLILNFGIELSKTRY